MKVRSIAVCQSCGAQSPRWTGKCGSCGQWGTIVEETTERRPAATRTTSPVALSDVESAGCARISTGVPEVDRVLGGGLARGSVVLLAGEPGVGKSTLTTQIALESPGVLIVCGEEVPAQVRARAERLGAVVAGLNTLSDPSIASITQAMTGSELVIVDSIQTVWDPDIPSAPGSVAQVRECGARLARAARDAGTTLVLVGHVTKDGSVAGPRVLEHLVDVVCAFEGDKGGTIRLLRVLKNRFGATDEIGFFEMTEKGLVAIDDASRYLLAGRREGLPGSVLAVTMQGKRPVLIEVQALVADSNLAMPRRTALGVSSGRLALLIAVLQRRLGLVLGGKDIFVSAAGGLKADEPAADLAVACALLSSALDIVLPSDLAVFGEVGLSGELRASGGSRRRLAEAANLGCTRVIVPQGIDENPPGLELLAASDVAEVRHILDLVTKPQVKGHAAVGM